MLMAMVAGIVIGLMFLMVRESYGADSSIWQSINNLLFQDITAKGANSAIGLFYIGGQLFIRSLQLVIVPMVFASVVLALCGIHEASVIGRLSAKTIGWFLLMSFCALILACAVGMFCFETGMFHATVKGLAAATGSTGSNPLKVILNIVPSNIMAVFSVNNAVLAVVFVAIVVGLSMNALGLGKDSVMYRGCDEVLKIIVVFLNYVVMKFGPIAIFMLLCRTFAIYGIAYLMPALVYVVICVALLLLFLFLGYPAFIALIVHENPVTFIRKIFKVIVFGFATSSSAATLPLNIETNVKDLGVDPKVASFVLPLGMTINMNGTAIMQVIATFFIAGCAGYDVTFVQMLVIMVLALIASAGTPAAPGAGAIILFTILAGVGFTNEGAMIAYSLILAINRPIEMLVTSLNCVGDSVAAIGVSKSEGTLNEEVYNA